MPNKPVVEHFKYCPNCSKSSITTFQENAIRCPDCDFELYFNPNSSAAALIFDNKNRLLVIERAREPAKGKYGVPGGFIDYHESAEDALRREVKEETNLDITSFQFFGSFPNLYPYKQVIYPTLDLYFTAKVDSFENAKIEESEVLGIHLVEPARVSNDQWAFRSLRAVIAKLLADKKT